MAQAIPSQHPAVVLRSHYNHLRALLAIAMVAVVGLTATVVILSLDESDQSGATSGLAQQQPAVVSDTSNVAPGTRYDGGPDEGTRGATANAAAAAVPSVGTRYDGGPEEGTRGAQSSPAPKATRYDGGPNEGTRGPGH